MEHPSVFRKPKGVFLRDKASDTFFHRSDGSRIPDYCRNRLLHRIIHCLLEESEILLRNPENNPDESFWENIPDILPKEHAWIWVHDQSKNKCQSNLPALSDRD